MGRGGVRWGSAETRLPVGPAAWADGRGRASLPEPTAQRRPKIPGGSLNYESLNQQESARWDCTPDSRRAQGGAASPQGSGRQRMWKPGRSYTNRRCIGRRAPPRSSRRTPAAPPVSAGPHDGNKPLAEARQFFFLDTVLGERTFRKKGGSLENERHRTREGRCGPFRISFSHRSFRYGSRQQRLPRLCGRRPRRAGPRRPFASVAQTHRAGDGGLVGTRA